jgi:hypothetical protein
LLATFTPLLKQLTVALLLLVLLMSSLGHVWAQPIPLLPPPSPENRQEVERISQNDKVPPKIEILTTELHEGKNVFEVRITDDSSLHTREVRYVHDNQLRIDGLFRDQNNVYKALIDIHPPARIVEVTAGDANGNIATAFREYDISKSQDIFGQIADMLSQVINYFQHLFAR